MDLRERPAQTPNRHPWELVRAKFFERLLADHDLLGARRWLDVGAGDAWFAVELLARLPTDASITAWDINYAPDDVGALDTAGGRVVLAAERPTDRFERVMLLDVIEHVELDHGFLTGIVDDLLEPDGVVLISVPAYQALFSTHDTVLGHFRRYTPGQLRSVAEGAGLSVVAHGGLFSSLLSARGLTKLRERISNPAPDWTGVGAWSGGPMKTRAIVAALSADAAVGRVLARRRAPLPGLSCWVLCTRST